MKLSELHAHLPDCLLDAGDDPEIVGVASLQEARPGELTFLSGAKYLPALATTQASAVILDRHTPCPLPCLRSPNPRLSFGQAIALFYQPPQLPPGIHPTALLGQDVRLGANVTLGAGVVVGDRVTIGENSVIFPNVTIYDDVAIGEGTTIHANCVVRERTQIGANCTIHAGTVLGGDGFGYELQGDGRWFKIPQSGYVVVREGVEIGCLCAIDRPAVGITEIGAGARIDNLVQIGHGCRLGEQALLVSQVGLSGGVRLGHHAILAGQVGIADHAEIGDGAIIGAKTGVISYVPPGERVMGYPSVPEKEWKRTVVIQRSLPQLKRTVDRLVERVAALEEQLAAKNAVPDDTN